MNARPFLIISTRLPPRLCGIGAYSWLLHQHWPGGTSHVGFLVVEGAAESAAVLSHSAIAEFNAKAVKLSRALESAGGADVLLHYAGRAYHRYGCPIWLPRVLAKWKAKYSAGRLLIFFHELPGQFPITSRHYWIDLCNRCVIRKLACLADVIVTNTSEHVTKMMKISGRADVHLVPVGSNILAPDNLSQQRVRSEFVIFGLPFSRWQTLQMFDPEIRSWQKDGHLTKLHLVGPRDERFDLRSEELIAAWPDPQVVTRHGMLPSLEVSKLLARAQFALTHATFENWSKSGPLMAYASHRCAIVGRLHTASAPLCFTISPDEVTTISEADLGRRTQSLKEWYDQNADWNIIARKISDLLPARVQEEVPQRGMTDEMVIISPESIPGAGGVGDYTLKLLAHWPSLPNLRLLTPKISRGRGTDAVLKQLPATGGKILVQYSAYGFDRAGYPRNLIRALIDWKTKTRGLLVIMFHEIWGFWPILNKNFIVQFLHRRSIKELLDCADVVFTSTSSQAGHLRALAPRTRVHVLPVGSNIRHDEDTDPRRKPGWAVLFGRQSARIRALRKMQGSLSSLATAGRFTKIITVGANGDNDTEERGLLSGFRLAEGFEQRGPRPEREISELLLTATFGISGQDELSYSKSGTFMAYAAHGLNIVAACADQSKEEPLCWLIAPRELIQGVSEPELKLRGERLCAWQKRTSSWQIIAAKFADVLQLSETSRMRNQAASR
jgi:hypothetical protein